MTSKPTLNLQGGHMIFTQNSDSLIGRDNFQILNIHVGDQGAGKYFAIETSEWAFESIDDLFEILIKARCAFEVPND